MDPLSIQNPIQDVFGESLKWFVGERIYSLEGVGGLINNGRPGGGVGRM